MAEAEKLIATNSTARADYFIQETLEAGIMLTGTEVKSLRTQSSSLKDAYIDIFPTHGTNVLEAWLLQMHIAPYSHGNIYNHEPLRKRKLLIARKDIDRLFGAITQEGLTLIPLRMYFKKGRAKVEIGLAKGKKHHDKRQDLKERSAKREMDVALKRKMTRK